MFCQILLGVVEGEEENSSKKWDFLCWPKSAGGLNFRDLKGFNQALIAKQIWRILSKSKSRVAEVLNSIYFLDTSILEAQLGSRPSFLWKSLLCWRDLLRLGLRIRIGNGESIRVSHDPWIPRCDTFKPIGVNPSFIQARASNFLDSEGNWSLSKLKEAFQDEDIEIIRRLPTNRKMHDKWIWHFDKKGDSVKSGYKNFVNSHLKNSSSNRNGEEMWKKVWNLKVPRKIKFFIWRAIHNIIPTNLNLKNRGSDLSPLCPICNGVVESLDHALMTCLKAKLVWNKISASPVSNQDFNNNFGERWSVISSSC